MNKLTSQEIENLFFVSKSLKKILDEIKGEEGKNIYKYNAPIFDKKFNNLLNELEKKLLDFFRYLKNEPKYDESLLLHLDSLNYILNKSRKLKLKLYDNMKNQYYKNKIKFSDLESIPNRNNLLFRPRVFLSTQRSLLLDNVNINKKNIEKEDLDQFHFYYDEMRKIYYKLIERVYDYLFMGKTKSYDVYSNETKSLVEEFFSNYLIFLNISEHANNWSGWVLKIGKYYDEYERAYIIYKNIYNGFEYASEKLLKDYMMYFRKKFKFDISLFFLNEIGNKSGFTKSLISFQEYILSVKNLVDAILNNKNLDNEFLLKKLSIDYKNYLLNFGLEWENLCNHIALKIYKTILTANKNETTLVNNKKPDIVIIDDNLKYENGKIKFASKIIDAKKSFLAIGEDIKNYHEFCKNLEFWILDNDADFKPKANSKITYKFSNDLILILKKLNEDFLVKEIINFKNRSKNLENEFLNKFIENVTN